MTTDALAKLDLTLERVSEIPAKERNRLLNYLLRWEQIDILHACLDVLIPLNPTRVSFLDLRARALLAQGRPDDALLVVQERLQLRSPFTARALLARVHLARGEAEAARQIALALIQEREHHVTAWGLLGEAESLRGDAEAALDVYRHLSELYPNSRTYLWGMVAFYRTRNDWISASGYAVRLLHTASQERPLSITYLRRLREYFRASGEMTRAVDVAAEIERRHAEEWVELKAALSRTRHPRAITAPRPRPVHREEAPSAPPEAENGSALPTFDQVPVSEEERIRIVAAVEQLFGFQSLLPGQLETLACVLRGEDVLTILPTGGGKSLCYQLPAMLTEQGTTLVISPLIALMKDQVDSLPAKLRQRATTINSSLEGPELHRRLERAAHGDYCLIYVAPERLRQPPFLHALRRASVSRLVVDEAHCVSVWGHDFRPDYLTIGRARRALGDPPLLAMTATAPSRVRGDILQHLGGPPAGSASGFRVIAGDVTRLNLQFEVFHARDIDEKLGYLLAFCKAEPGSGIVYAGTRARCEELASLLCRYGIGADHYHAGISDRTGTQDDFMSGRTRVVVATVAFGLGIDKPDIRFIVHFVPPPSLESYYQEAGRAGRDGLPARCLLMYSRSDRATLTRRAHRDALPIEFLRAVYEATKRRLAGNSSGRVAMADLERDLQADETRVRVALSLLEEAGLVRRGPDLPSAAVVRLAREGRGGATPHELNAFCRAVRLRPGQPLSLDLAQVARQTGLSLDSVEERILEWANAEWLAYRPAGRDLMLELLPLPADASERIAALLERYETIQAQRVDEITAYAQTRRCRHGHINAYLGGRAIERCAACDNCIEIPPLPGAGLPDEREQLLTILRCVANARWSWGRVSLARILRGDDRGSPRRRSLHPEARSCAGFGALAFRSQAAVQRMLDRLEGKGFLRARRLDNGGEVLDLTSTGRSALQRPAALNALLSPARRPPPLPKVTKRDEKKPDVDETLFQKLRAWRREQARARRVPPFFIFHASHLRAIAAHLPTTLEALSALKGVGPGKLERYGDQIINLVSRHLGEEASDAQGQD
jgi:ATP-dependent DNA helicase RecQ